MLALRQSLRLLLSAPHPLHRHHRSATITKTTRSFPKLHFVAALCSDNASSSSDSAKDPGKAAAGPTIKSSPLSSPPPPPNLDRISNERLFRVARIPRKSRAAQVDRIDHERAVAVYGLSAEQLDDLPHIEHRHFPNDIAQRLYLLNDVHGLARMIHGERLEGIMHKLQKQRAAAAVDGIDPIMELRLQSVRVPVYPSAADNATTRSADRVVKIALFFNCLDATSKFTAAYLTGSASLFAEGVHSSMDSFNQVVLYFGIRFSHKNPDGKYPYGYGNARYIGSMVSGCGIMAFGCGLSLYHGVGGLIHPGTLEPLTYAFYALFCSLCFQGASFANAVREAWRKSREMDMSMYDYVKTSADPTLAVVLLEDTASVVGVLWALGAITLSSYLQSTIPDAAGSIGIGCLLGAVAYIIIKTNASHLVGRSLSKNVVDDIVRTLSKDRMIGTVSDVKATSIGVQSGRFKAELDFNGREITSAYLESCDMDRMLEEVQRIKTTEELHDFMVDHGEQIINREALEVDRIENDVMDKYPWIRHIDLEAK